MSALIGCTVPTSGVLDAQVGARIGVRDYFWDKHNPSYLTGYAKDRPAIISWKFRTDSGVIPATDVSTGKLNSDFNIFLDIALGLGFYRPVIAVQHETDAATAAKSGTPPQLNDALLKCSSLMRNHPLWKPSGARVGVVLTGWRIADAARAPAFKPALDDCDVPVTDPYATMNTTLAQEIADDLAYMKANYPTKELQFGEWGVPVGKPGRSQEILDFAAYLKTPACAQVTAAYYWEGSGFGVMGTPDQAALVAAIKGSLAPAPVPIDWQARYTAELSAFTNLQNNYTALQAGYAKLHDAASSSVAALNAGMS